MWTKSVVLWTCLLGVCWLGGVRPVHGADPAASVSGSGVVDANGVAEKLSAFEQGLQPFYRMTHLFLGLVQNHDSLIPQLNITTGINNTLDIKALLAFAQKYSNLLNTKALIYHALGYLVCVSIGVLFVVVVPICGFFFCCCRICGRCGGKVKPREGRHHKCRQYTCGTLLFVFVTIIMMGMVFAFMTNEHMHMRLSSLPNEGLVPRSQRWLQSVRHYTDSLSIEINSKFNIDIENKLDAILMTIYGLPDATFMAVDELTNSSTILASAQDLALSVTDMKALLANVSSTENTLTTQKPILGGKLTVFRDAVTNILTSCTVDACTALKSYIPKLVINADFTTLTVNSQITSLNNVGDLQGAIEEGTASFNGIKRTVSTKINSSITDLDLKKREILRDIKKTVGDISLQIKNISAPLTGVDNVLVNEVQPQIEKYAQYYWYAGIGLCCMFLLIVVCFYLGIVFGVCGDAPYENSSACNKGVGANLLLAAVGFCFLFSGFLMLMCTILFIPGAIFHGEVCQFITPDLATSPYIQYLSAASRMYVEEFNLTSDISTIVSDCKANRGLYGALGLENTFPLSLLDIDKYDVKTKIDQLKALSVDLTSVKVINDDAKTKLETLRDSTVDSIDFTALFAELDKKRPSSYAATAVTKMMAAKAQLPAGKSTELQAKILELETLMNKDIKVFEDSLGDLRTKLDMLNNLIDGQKGTKPTLSGKVGGLILSLEKAQQNINNDVAIKKLFSDSADRLYEQLKNFSTDIQNSIKNDVGGCRPLYNAISGLINVVCVDFLYPFNGFWFSFGWCLAFFIPAIITAVHLAGSYRKSEEFDPSDTKSFDDPNFDAYSGGMFPDDNIPLEDYNRRKNRGGAVGRGLPNGAYERDGQAHPSSHAPPASMPYRDNYSRDNYAHNGGPPAYPDRQPRHDGGKPVGGHGGGPGGGHAGATPPNPPHYYNNRPRPY